MKKAIKYFFTIMLLAIPIGFIIGFSKAWYSQPSITAAGSTAVQPLLTELGNNYNFADVVVQPGGSGFGIKVAATNTKSLGNASKNTFNSVQRAEKEKDGYTYEMWDSYKLKTVTIAWDGIAIVYKPINQNDNPLVINEDNIKLIYESFAGDKQIKLSDLFIGNGNDNKPDSKNIHIAPYARTGGSKASGTAASFLNESELVDNWDSIKNIKKKLETGDYGPYTTSTNESNVESWNRFRNESKQKNGTMIYLSTGFVHLNRKIIENAGFHIARYYNKSINEVVEPNTNNITNKKYGWYSPLNTLIPIEKANQTTKDFVWWIVSNPKANQIINTKGYSYLSDSDKALMFLDEDNIIESNYKDNKDAFFRAHDTIWNPRDINENNEYIGTKYGNWYGAPKNIKKDNK